MPDFSRLSSNMFKKGDVLRAEDLQALADAIRRQVSLPVAFQNGAMALQAPNVPTASIGNIILARAYSAVSAEDEEFPFYDAIHIVGTSPAGGTGTAKNFWFESFEEGEYTFLYQNQANGDWIPAKTSGEDIIWFELLENKSYTDTYALAAEVVGGSATEAELFVLDPDGLHFGRGPIDGASDDTPGYRGFALKLYDDYASSGLPGYLIMWMEQPAYMAVVTLLEDFDEDGTKCELSEELIYGAPTRSRPPFHRETVDDDLEEGQCRVLDDFGLANYVRARQDDRWLIIWEENSEHFVFLLPHHEVKLRYKATGLTVSSSMPDFVMTSPTALVGPAITGDITVDNNPKLLNDGDPVFAMRDRTSADLFTTADMGNFVPALKGLKDWDAGVNLPRCLSRTDADKLVWERLEVILTQLDNYDSGNPDLVVGHDGTKAVWVPADTGGGSGSGGGTEYSAGCGIQIISSSISVSNTALAGEGLIPAESGCALDVNVDNCTLTIVDDVVQVDLESIAGDGLIAETSGGACELKINYGCGLEIDTDQLKVNPADLAGDGLVNTTGCALEVAVGCGLTINGGAVEVDPADLAGDGLEVGSGCALQVNVGCGLVLVEGEVRVDANTLAGDGLVQTGTCTLAVNTGCGLEIVADAVRVKASDLAGSGLGTSGTCGLQVNVGCGLVISADAVAVNPSDLAGDGLVTGAGCSLAVGAGCGITVAANTVSVNVAALAGAGLIPVTGDGACALAVNVGCGLKIETDAVLVDLAALLGDGLTNTTGCAIEVAVGCGLTINGGAVEVEASDLAGAGLVAGSGCELAVGAGCGIEVNADAVRVKNTDIAGEYLNPGAGCVLDVENTEVTVIKSIDDITLTLAGGSLTVSLVFTTVTLTVLEQAEGTSGNVTDFVATTDCES